MADMSLTERIRHIADSAAKAGAIEVADTMAKAAAELDRREAIVAAAEAWAKAKRSEQSEDWPRSASTLLSSETAEANLLAILPAAALKG